MVTSGNNVCCGTETVDIYIWQSRNRAALSEGFRLCLKFGISSLPFPSCILCKYVDYCRVFGSLEFKNLSCIFFHHLLRKSLSKQSLIINNTQLRIIITFNFTLNFLSTDLFLLYKIQLCFSIKEISHE